MSTVDEVVRDVLASAGTSAGAPLVARWLNNRYRELVSKVKFRHLRKVGELSLPAIVSDGTVSITKGSTAVSGTSTTFETSISAGTQEYYYLRTDTNWYRIASITNDTALVLESAFTEDTVTDGTYEIIKRFHPLDASARWANTFYFDRLYYELDLVPLEALDLLFPGRIIAGHYPTHIAQVGIDSSNSLMYEIYPPPEDAEIIHYIYYDLPSELTLESTIPPVIDTYVLKEGVMIDLYRFNKIAALKPENMDPQAAAVFANEEAKQRTIWKRAIFDAIRTSRGADDITFLLQMTKGSARRSYDQRTAHDYIYDNWSR